MVGQSLATALDNLLNNDFYRVSPISTILIYFVFLLCCLFVISSFCVKYSTLVMTTFIAALVVSLFSYFFALHFLENTYFLPIGGIITLFWAATISIWLVMGLLEYRNRQQALSMFGRFLDPKLVLSLCAQGKLNAEEMNKGKELTVLFADIRNFTSMSEQYSASKIMSLLNEYFSTQVEIVFETQGTVDKFIGDCIMAFWGAPVDSDEHAINAIEAALRMEEELLKFKQTLSQDIADFDIGIGLHTGKAVVGLIGTKQRVDYTVIGDTVNLASRIEGLTKGISRILVSHSTVVKAQDYYEFIYHGEFNVKGRKEPVKLYQPKRK